MERPSRVIDSEVILKQKEWISLLKEALELDLI